MQHYPSQRNHILEYSPEFLVAGMMTRDFILDSSGKAHNDLAGGSALYAAAAIDQWEGMPGLIATVGENYPVEWLEKAQLNGIATSGVRVLPRDVDQRQFISVSTNNSYATENPVAFYAKYQLPFPKSLLGYQSPDKRTDDPSLLQPLVDESIMPEYIQASAAHICAMDYRHQLHIATQLRKYAANIITLEPGAPIMIPTHWEEIPALLDSAAAFFPSEKQLFSLFQGRSNDLLEMVEALGVYGSKLIVVRKGNNNFLLYDAYARKKFLVPAYPVKTINPMNIEDALCGGFLAGYKKTYDPLEALLRGMVSASHAAECASAFQMKMILPGLTQARLESIRSMVQPL